MSLVCSSSDPCVLAPLQGTLAQAVKKGHWVLLDEINLAAAETLECLSGLLEGSAGSLVLLDRGDTGEDCCHPQGWGLITFYQILIQSLVCLPNPSESLVDYV